jgi:hypothetical protein
MPDGGQSEPVTPPDIAILLLIASHLFTFGKPASASESQRLNGILAAGRRHEERTK